MPSESAHIATAYPVSFFATIRSNTSNNRSMIWMEICDLLQDHSQRPYPRKEDAPLLAPTSFRGPRAAANATESGLIVLDADHGLALNDALAALRDLGLAAVVYTTASHGCDGKGDRFRVILPLAAPVDIETHKQVGLLVAKMIGGEDWRPDMGKLGCYSIFYLPGQYVGVQNQFHALDGTVLAAEDWLTLAEIVQEEVPLRSSNPSSTLTSWRDLDDCPFVRPEWVDEYLTLGGDWHRGLFRFMCRVAARAGARGYALNESELANLARDLDVRDGSHYQSGGKNRRDFEAEARNALAFAGGVTPRRFPEQSAPIQFGPADPSATSPLVTSDPRLPVPVPHPAVQPYAFEDQAFAGRNGAVKNPTFQYLAERCVAIGDGYFIRSPFGWERYAKTNVTAALVQQHGSRKVGVTEIKDFLKLGIVTFAGITVIPGAGPMVTIGGRRLLNTWHETRLPGRNEHADEAEIILRLIWENLCDLPPTSVEEMYEIAMGREYHLFRWVVQWLASVYQNPGKHIGTVLWFIGPNMGVGKGTLLGILADLIGRQWVGKANATEFGRGWTDFLTNKLLLECDEFETGSRTDLNRFFKMYVGNDSVSVAKRHIGSFDTLNTFNFIATTNKPHPIQLERGDRRHTLVQTSNDVGRNTRAVEFNSLPADARQHALEGFAAILAAIDVEADFIRKPFPTPLRAEIMTWSMGPVERWFAATDAKWAVGETFSAGTLYERFVDWANQEDGRASAQVSNATQFGREMSLLEAQGLIARKKANTIAYTKLAYHDPASEAVVARLVDVPQPRRTEEGWVF